MRLVPPPILQIAVDVDATGKRQPDVPTPPVPDNQARNGTQPENGRATRAVDVARSTPWWSILLGIAILYRS